MILAYNGPATFADNQGLDATFTASGIQPGDPADTTFSGVVLDASQTPIPGATVQIEGTTVTGLTDAKGRFLLTGVPVGAFVLKVDPSASPRPETFPPLEFEIVTISGVENTLGMPIILPQIDTDMAKLVGGNEDVVLEMKGVPGAQLTVLANSATFPDGSTTGMASVSQVHMDQVPMPPPNGSLPPIAGTLQPIGAKFDPPVRIQFPNINGLPPGTVTEMYQFHHDTSRFVPVGKGTVTEDGRFIISDPGFGLQTGGWHVVIDIAPRGGMANCDNRDQCTTGSEDPNSPDGCKQIPIIPPPDTCRVEGGFLVVNDAGEETGFVIDESCTVGKCSSDREGVKCLPDSLNENQKRFDPRKIKKALKLVLETFLFKQVGGLSCLEIAGLPPTQSVLNTAITELNRQLESGEFKIACNEAGRPCGQHAGGKGAGQIDITQPIAPEAGECGPLDLTIFHEMLHDLIGNSADHVEESGKRDFRIDLISACTKRCFSESKARADFGNVPITYPGETETKPPYEWVDVNNCKL